MRLRHEINGSLQSDGSDPNYAHTRRQKPIDISHLNGGEALLFAKIVARAFVIECLICIVVGRNCARRRQEEIKTLKVSSATTEPNTRNQNQIMHPLNNQTRTLNEPFFPLHLFYNYPPVTLGNISQCKSMTENMT